LQSKNNYNATHYTIQYHVMIVKLSQYTSNFGVNTIVIVIVAIVIASVETITFYYHRVTAALRYGVQYATDRGDQLYFSVVDDRLVSNERPVAAT